MLNSLRWFSWSVLCLLLFWSMPLLSANEQDRSVGAGQSAKEEEKDGEKKRFGDDLAWKFGPAFGLIESGDYKTEAAFSVNVEMANRLYWGDRDHFQLGIAPHIAYVMKGSAFNDNGDKVVLNMHYLEIDILSGYVSFLLNKSPLGLNLMFGFPFAFLLDSEYTIDNVTVNNTDRIEVFDLCAYGSIGLEYGFQEHGKVTFDIRFETGLLDIFKSSSAYSFTTYNVFFNVGYVYNVAAF